MNQLDSEIEDDDANGPKPARIAGEKKTHAQVLFAALAAPNSESKNDLNGNANDAMRLKRTTVLSGNFAKKTLSSGGGGGGGALSARDRAASENMQYVNH